MTNLITSVPSQEELQGGDTKTKTLGQIRAVPRNYLSGVEAGATPEQVNTATLKALRNELNFGNLDDETVRVKVIEAGYAIACNLGAVKISGLNSEAFQLLEASQPYKLVTRATTKEEAVVHEQVRGEGVAAIPSLAVNIDSLASDSESSLILAGNYNRLRADVRPEDVKLIHFMKNVAHEAGHIIQFGVGRLLADEPERGNNGYDHMSSVFLRQHPEQGVTPNHHTNVRIHDERFAEGYGNIVLREMLRQLGYEEETTSKVIRATGLEALQSPTAQYLDQLSETVGLKDIADKKGEKLYAGDLGYTKPLTEGQVIADLAAIGTYLKGLVPDSEAVLAAYEEPGRLESVARPLGAPAIHKVVRIGR